MTDVDRVKRNCTCINTVNKQVLVKRRDWCSNKKLSYRSWTARCVVSVEILSVTTQQCRNYSVFIRLYVRRPIGWVAAALCFDLSVRLFVRTGVPARLAGKLSSLVFSLLFVFFLVPCARLNCLTVSERTQTLPVV